MEPNSQKEPEQEPKQENQIDDKEITSIEEGKLKGLSKQQLRKLEKRLAAEKKKKVKEEQALELAEKQKNQQPNKEKKITNKKIIDEAHFKQFQTQKITVQANKKLPSKDQENILITSALPYVNNVPHLGNIIGCVLSADVYARFKRLHGSNVLYICGTDEYGTATQVKAMDQKKTPRQICDYYHAIHRNIYNWFDIGFDYFGRTSTEWHSKICQEIFTDINKEGRILKQQTEQLHCENCDFYLADRFIIGVCPHCQSDDARGDQCDKCGKLFNSPTELKNYQCSICRKNPVLKSTKHFYINLPQIQPQLQKWIAQSSVKGKWSENSIGLTKGWTNMGLKPKCITRNLKWGVNVPIPQYKQLVFYVWFDAPIGYISITANLFQENYKAWWQSTDVNLYQFMGKDNVPFHTVIFPCSLLATKKPWTLLHHISTTEYLTYEGGKFSKSRGTGVFGDNAIQTGIPPEVWRYYLLVNRPENSDSDFSWTDFRDKNNNELLANLGNLVNRALTFCYSTYEKQIPKVKVEELQNPDLEFLKVVQEKYQKYKELLNAVEIKQGLRLAMEISSLGNKYLQDSKFWLQANNQSGRSIVVLAVVCNFIRFLSLLFEPYMPSCSAKINFLLGIPRSSDDQILGFIISKGNFIDNFCNITSTSKGLKQPVPLFRVFTPEEIEEFRAKYSSQKK